jgi:hypothetical protein
MGGDVRLLVSDAGGRAASAISGRTALVVRPSVVIAAHWEVFICRFNSRSPGTDTGSSASGCSLLSRGHAVGALVIVGLAAWTSAFNRSRVRKAKAVPIRVDDVHLPRLPRSIFRWFRGSDPTAGDLPVQRIHIVDDEVCCATDLAVTGVLGEKERESVPRQLREHRKAWLELVFPIDVETETLDVELSGSLPAGHSKLWKDALVHDELPVRSAQFVGRLCAMDL